MRQVMGTCHTPEVMAPNQLLGGVPAAVVSGHQVEVASSQSPLQGHLVLLAPQGRADDMRCCNPVVRVPAAQQNLADTVCLHWLRQCDCCRPLQKAGWHQLARCCVHHAHPLLLIGLACVPWLATSSIAALHEAAAALVHAQVAHARGIGCLCT